MLCYGPARKRRSGRLRSVECDMGRRCGFSNTLAVALLVSMTAPAAAQFSDSYSFIQAVKDANGEKAMTFLNKPGQPTLNTRDGTSGDGALHIVVRRHDDNWLAFLLGRGAQVDIRDKQGNTPLLIAAQLSDADSARLLLLARADVNATNTRGETPLIVAVQQRDQATIRLLLAAGANPRTPDTIAGKSARDYAAEDARSATILKLIDETKPAAKPAHVSGPVLPH